MTSDKITHGQTTIALLFLRGQVGYALLVVFVRASSWKTVLIQL